MTNLGWGGGDGRPEKKTCPECGKTVRGLKQHRRDAHGAASRDVNGAALAVGDKVRRTDATIVRDVLAIAGEDMGS